jgi:two-component system response regulator AtoC
MRTFIYGPSPRTQELKRKIGQIARAPVPVLIEGETGTGKETLARQIHALASPGQPFTRHACAAGKPLDALEDFRGWIFFKSVNRLDPAAQEQLLTAIDRQSSEGGRVRLLSSSTQPLDRLVAQGRFPAALYHHLAGARVRVAALRERFADVPEMFAAFVEEYASAAGMPAPAPSGGLLTVLESYSWPGNGRELSNFAAMFAASGNSAEMTEELKCRLGAAPPGAPPKLPLREQVRRASLELESGIILRTLQTHRWNRRRAAETLNISYRSLLYKMKACNLRGENAGGGV